MSNDALPSIRVGRAICGDLTAALRREWLVTNGLGGYASGSLAGVATRRYHGLLVAALEPPVGRTVLVGGTVEWATYRGQRYALSTHEYADGTVDPQGYRHLESFALEGMLPVWLFALGDALLERRVWMAHGQNTSYLGYRLLRGSAPLELEVAPLVTYRDFHSLRSGQSWRPQVETHGRALQIELSPGAPPLTIGADRGVAEAGGDWYWGFQHRAERERGLDDRSDFFATGVLRITLEPHAAAAVTMSVEPTPPAPEAALAAARERQTVLIQRAGAEGEPTPVQQLVLAADQFIVERRDEAGAPGTTVIAGYHWFNDWGRDTMIALPGLTLSTGRATEAAQILRTFARYLDRGLLPNNFPDCAGSLPGYNTVDATLWYVLAIRSYDDVTGDRCLADDLLPVLREIVEWHRRGTRHGIKVDPADGLLRAGEPGVQLTWMDAKVGEWVVTPRTGKPVEINALWYNALRALAGFLERRADPTAAVYAGLAEQARRSFQDRFWDAARGYLADVVDGPDGDDWSLRPNQIFAVALPEPLIEGIEASAVVERVGAELLTSYGLRSLAPGQPGYQGNYGGDPARRDGAYHQGPVWGWLLGPFTEAYARVTGDRAGALRLLEPIADHLADAGMGSVSEIFAGDPPHAPHGVIAQAWSVAEVLRVWRQLAEEPPQAPSPPIEVSYA